MDNPRGLTTALEEYESAFGDENVPEESMDLIHLAHIQIDKITIQDGELFYISISSHRFLILRNN